MLPILANFGKEGAPQTLIPKISRETLAGIVGTTRSRVNFFMNRFRKFGFIEYSGGLKIPGSWRRHSCLPRRDSDLLISWNEDELAFESRQRHYWPPRNADKNKLFLIGVHRRLIFFAPPSRDSVLTGARPGRSEKAAQSDSSAAPIHRVDLRMSETRLGARLGFRRQRRSRQGPSPALLDPLTERHPAYRSAEMSLGAADKSVSATSL